MVGDVHDIITCAKFQIEIFMGYDFCREMLCISAAIAVMQCLSVRLSVTFRYQIIQMKTA